MIDDLIRQLVIDEGFRKSAYQDSEGYWTIGYGTLIDERLGAGLTETEAGILLRNRVFEAMRELDRTYPWWKTLPEPARLGLANMAYNLGIVRLSGFRKMLAALKAGQFAKAADEALDSRWAKQVGDRAERIAALYRSR